MGRVCEGWKLGRSGHVRAVCKMESVDRVQSRDWVHLQEVKRALEDQGGGALRHELRGVCLAAMLSRNTVIRAVWKEGWARVYVNMRA